MNLRTKLLSAFISMIILAGIIAYTGYNALQVMAVYQTEATSSEMAQIKLLEGSLQGARFLLYENKEYLKDIEKIFGESVAALNKIKAVAYSQAIKDAISAKVKLVQQTEKNYKKLGQTHAEHLTIGGKLGRVGNKLTASLDSFDEYLLKSNSANGHLSRELIADFYEVRILAWRYTVIPTKKIQSKLLTRMQTLLDRATRSITNMPDTKSQRLLTQVIASAKQYQEIAQEFTDQFLK